MKRITSCVISVTERVSLNSEKMETDLPKIIFEKGGGERDLNFADEDDIIDAVYGHGELTMTVCTLCVCLCVSVCMCVACVCVFVCLCVHVCCLCVCDDGTSVTVCLNVRVCGGVADLTTESE